MKHLVAVSALAFVVTLGMAQILLRPLPEGLKEVLDLEEGRWALAFVMLPGCPACVTVIRWLREAKETFPEIRPVLVAPWESAELREEAGGLPILLDEGGRFGATLGVRKAPTLLFFVEGTVAGRMEWPFSKDLFLQRLGEVHALTIPSPRDFLGKPAPDFVSISLDGEEVALTRLPKPLLLAFLTLGCAPCWETLPVLQELSKEVAVVLVAGVGPQGLAPEDRVRLAHFLEGVQKAGGRAWVLLDPRAEGHPLARAFRVRRSPTFLLVDNEGVAVGVWEGEKHVESLVRGVQAKWAQGKQED